MPLLVFSMTSVGYGNIVASTQLRLNLNQALSISKQVSEMAGCGLISY